jgi:beta-N-acetylhexosaminidase
VDLRDKIGQRLMLTFDGPELGEKVARFIVELRAGGVILFGKNITGVAQVTQLNRDLQDLAARHGLPPLIIGIDEEGGRVSRMPADGQDWIAPSQMAQSAAGGEAVATSAGVIARRLRKLGFNLDFAPVADINSDPANPAIGIRSFGIDPELIGQSVATAVRAYLAEDLAPCVKHFPGHGDTAVDSHLGLPVVSHDLAHLEQFELKPFRQAFAAGVPALMSAHILYPQIEASGLPATLSPYFLTRLLREELGYQGLVFSDALEMQAIAKIYPGPQASLMTLLAGADIALPMGSLANQKAAFEYLAERAAELDLDGPLARILAFKERFALPPLPANPAREAEDARLVAGVARRSVTALGPVSLLPLSPQEPRPLVIDFELPLASPVEEGRQPGRLLKDLLTARWPGAQFMAVPAASPPEATSDLVVEAARQASLLLIVLRNATRWPAQAQLLQKLLEAQPRAVVVAARDPYDLKLAPQAPLRRAIYGDPPVSIQALAGALSGEFSITGQLPVKVE